MKRELVFIMLCIILILFGVGASVSIVGGGIASSSPTQTTMSVTPYTEVRTTVQDIKSLEIYNVGKSIRVAFGDETTVDTGDYWVIPSTSGGYTKDNLNISSLTVRLLGDTTADTVTARLIIWK